MIKFYYNGIRASDKILQKAYYSMGAWVDGSQTRIAIYADSYRGFNPEVKAHFTVKNDTDSMTDYFEKDCIYVEPDHPSYEEIRIAYLKQHARNTAWALKRNNTLTS